MSRALLDNIETEEDRKYSSKFWEVMPFFYKDEIIKYAFPGFEEEPKTILEKFIPNVREMYKQLTAEGLVNLQERCVYAFENGIECPWDPLEIFKPELFKRDKPEVLEIYLKHRGITSKKEIENEKINYKNEKPLPYATIVEDYWSKHNLPYLNLIDTLLLKAQLNDKLLERAKLVIVIAAMNETIVSPKIRTSS